MKNRITLLLAIVVLASCSAPKYSYNFGHTDYYAGKKQAKSSPASLSSEVSPLTVDPQMLTASLEETPIVVSELVATPAVEPVAKTKTFVTMNKSEKKAFVHQFKKEIKTIVKAKKDNSTEASRGSMDNDLKLAAIFGAVGIVGLLIGGNAFSIIGGIALLIGVVFFVKWLIRQ